LVRNESEWGGVFHSICGSFSTVAQFFLADGVRMEFRVSFQQLVTRILKYLIEGGVIMLAASLLSPTLQLAEIAVLGLTAAATFSLLDFVAPSVSMSARSGAGYGIGLNLVGFPR